MTTARNLFPSDPLFPLQWHLHNTGTTPGSVAGHDINVLPVWTDYTGTGRLVGVADDGMDDTHPDLVANYRADLAWDAHLNEPGARARQDDEAHGVPVAGLIAATAFNGLGGVGVAWGAEFTMYRLGLGLPDPEGQDTFAIAAEKMLASGVEISNNSWGARLSLLETGSKQVGIHDIGRDMAQHGRGGLGIVTLFSSGNERAGAQDANDKATTSMPWIIAVAASDQAGGITSYSSPGASVLITAPGAEPATMVTTDRQGVDGYNRSPGTDGDYTTTQESYFTGTSAAAPVAAGVVALMLEANSGLGYRDVQEILAYSARRATFLDQDTDKAYNGASDWNGGALLASHDFGYGHIDAHAAVRLAESWAKVGTMSNLVVEQGNVAQRALTVEAGQQATAMASFAANYRVEQITVTVSLETENLQEVTLELISPDGMVSRLLNRPPHYHVRDPESGEEVFLPKELDYTFNTVLNWGADLDGVWTLRLSNSTYGATVQLNDWSIQAYTAGHVGGDGVQIFTDEYARFAEEDPGRSVLDAGNGATLNAAAVTGDVRFDLAGGPSSIHDQEIRLNDVNAFRNLVSGDGNDILIGNGSGNILMAGRGNNEVDGGAGLDVMRLIGEFSNYAIEHQGDVVSVRSETLSGGGIDTIRNVELLHFSDRVVLTRKPTDIGPNLFDEASYLGQNPDVAAAVSAGLIASGLQHYAKWGAAEGRNPNALFDESWYLAQNPDVAQAVESGTFASGLQHYRAWGWSEGRAPSAWMDTSAYLRDNPDVEAAGVDPLQHDLQYGAHEGRVIVALGADLWT